MVTESQENIVGVSAANGRLLWKIPFTTQYVQNIPTPLAYRDSLILSGLANGIMAVRAHSQGDQWTTQTIWHNTQVSLYMSSPVADGGLIFGFSHYKSGQFFCIDAGTGATLWTGPPRQGDNAAVLVSGGNLILLKNDGELIVAKADRKGFELVRRYTVADSPTWAHPLVLRQGIITKDAASVALWTPE